MTMATDMADVPPTKGVKEAWCMADSWRGKFLLIALLIGSSIVNVWFGLQKYKGEEIDPSNAAFMKVLNTKKATHLQTAGTTDMVYNSGAKCLSLHGDELPMVSGAPPTASDSFNDLVASSRSVYITAPGKAAGTTVQQFAWKCSGHYDKFNTRRDRVVLSAKGVDYRRDVFLENPKSPKVMATHVGGDFVLTRLFEQTPRDTLTVYVYREETDRIISALLHILNEDCKGIRDHFIKPNEMQITDDNQCILAEAAIVDKILRPRTAELGGGNQDILTCDLYQSIEDNFPNFVFVSINKVSDLLDVIGKHHCPSVDAHIRRDHGASNRRQMMVKMNTTEDIMTLEDWIEEKRDKIEWTFDYKGNKCKAKTRQMEDELFSCTDQILQVTRKTSF